MTGLPASIEASLLEAGFSSTEVLILKHLMVGEAVTLRELASKTGKSTGVLDQASKKLLERKILIREQVNDTSKYSVSSLDSIMACVAKDVQKKQQLLTRKHQDFGTFLANIEFDRERPEMEYFEGKEGLQQAYTKLLQSGEEFLHYLPVRTTTEEDPLRDFRVQYFRERRKNGIYSRVIAHNTPLGRRYQCRDPFEFRSTILVPEDRYPFLFEKIIAGDIVACFSHDEEKACFIHYPKLARAERAGFKVVWELENNEASATPDEGNGEVIVTPVPFKTKTFSAVRDFFLSKKSFAAFALCAVLAGIVTYGMYQQNVYLNTQRIREKVVAIAATGASQFDLEDINTLWTVDDVHKPAYEKTVLTLLDIQQNNKNVMFTYILRPTEEENIFAFVAASDALDPFAEIDSNNDGVIDEVDELVTPGVRYDISDMDALTTSKLTEPKANSGPYTDQWGTFITGYAPIKDASGGTLAILAADINAEEVFSLTKNTFGFFYYFLGFFVLFVIIRLAAFNRSLCKELLELLDMKLKSLLIVVGLCAVLAGVVTYGLQMYSSNLNTQRVREKVLAIAVTGVPLFSSADIDELHTEKDMSKGAYTRVVQELDSIRERNEGLKYVYIIRPTKVENIYEFVADSYGLDIGKGIDFNNDGILGEEDEIPVPGMPYDVSEIPGAKAGMEVPTAMGEPFTDQWGTFISGFAPIKDENGQSVAVLGIDQIADDVQELTRSSFTSLYYFLGFFVLFVIVRLAAFNRPLWKELMRVLRIRSVLISLGICAVLAVVVTYGMYTYTLNLMKDEIGNRLMSIAATAAPEIDAADLEPLRFARDMKRPEYQRVYKQLNEIRDRNEDILYVYIMRPSWNESMYEFVVDADSNYFLPYPEDPDPIEVVPPGTSYDVNQLAQYDEREILLTKPLVDNNFTTDKWGSYVSASAPILNDNGEGIAILGVDMDVTDIYIATFEKFKLGVWLLSSFLLLLIAKYVLVFR